ncbi:MAG TPA: AMP-binding protein, partial [Gemmataceae bacterium]|nr:AMP-binding protein [Gemmataceae bacterium]
MAYPDSPSRDGPPGGQPATLTALLRSRAVEQADALAYAFLADGETVRDRFTYAELDRQARQIAGLLRNHGAIGKPVLLLYPPGLDYIAAFFGCVYAGAIAAPAYPPHRNRSLDRLLSIIRDAGARTVLCTNAVRESIDRAANEAPELRTLDWLATNEPRILEVEPFCDETVTPERVAFLQYTSGSTSTPRGVILSH